MKITRQKRVRNYLKFFTNNYQFRKPYQILVDATFCQEALKCKINIQEQVPKYLCDEVKLMTTPCVIKEAESLGPLTFGAMIIVKQFKARMCGHEKSPIAAADCLHSMVASDNPDHYFIATQDFELSEMARKISVVPLLFINHNAINLEKPSNITINTATQKIKEKLKGTDFQAAVLKKLKVETFGEETPLKKKKRKFKGPNPLSCKKKRNKIAPLSTATKSENKVQKRKRNRHKKKESLVV